jgi:hypothetical protein
LVLLAAFAWSADPASAVTIRVDYRYDDAGNKFFGINNPQGATGATMARTALQAAADFYSTILTDTLSPIVSPQYVAGGTTVNWRWTARFTNPNTGFAAELVNDTSPPAPPPPLPIAADEYVIFAGARFLVGDTVGSASPGVVKSTAWFQNGSLTPAQEAQRDAIDALFFETATMRGETSGFVSWGGSLSVDNDPMNVWHFDHTTPPTIGSQQVDLYSVAVHEMAHALGFGVFSTGGDPTVWQTMVGTDMTGPIFTGTTAVSVHGGPVPLKSPTDRSHWKDGTQSKVYGGTANQIAAMTDAIVPGTRKHLTDLDAAALLDLGWELDPPMPAASVPGDYNGNGVVDAADYTVWRDSLGQMGTNLPANGNNSGASANKIDSADYTYWKTRFGNMTPMGAGAGSFASAVPEPDGAALLLLGAGAFVVTIRRPGHANHTLARAANAL